jgi:hypothetical protein
MTRDELLTRLSNLLPSQFEEVLYRLAIPYGHLSASSAPQTMRATEALRYLEANGGFDQLAQLLVGPRPAGGAAAPAARPAAPAGKHTIVFLAANPIRDDQLALDREAREIQIELERSGYRDRFEFVTRWAVQPLDLLRELRKLKPTVVHFSGHGGKPGLYFQGENGAPALVSADALRDTFGAAGSSVRLAILSACYSDVQAAALATHVDCVVGVNGTIRDGAARNFAIGFYGGLGEHESVGAAFRQGCAAISLGGIRESERPQLKTRSGIDADHVILAAVPA